MITTHTLRSARLRLAAVLLALTSVLVTIGAGCGTNSPAEQEQSSTTITVFAAASLTEAFTELGEQFSAAQPDMRVIFNFAASQDLAGQIENGAPADVFASADMTNMEKVRALVGEPHVFAANTLTLVVEAGNPLDVQLVEDLADEELKVVLAAPEVPAGKYAAQLLSAAGVTLKPVSLEDSVKGVVTKVSLGEADAGIAYATDVVAAGGSVDGVAIPAADNVTATYPVAVVKDSEHASAAEKFVQFVLSSNGQQILKAYGFLPART